MKPFKISRSRRALIGGGLGYPLLTSVSFAQPASAPAIPVKDFFRHSAISRVVLSPDGKHIAGLREFGERINITVVNLETRKATIITRFSDGDVASLRWVNSDRLMFTMIDRERGGGDQVGSGLFVIDRDGNAFRPLVERSLLTDRQRLLPYGTEFHSRVFENGQPTEEVLVEVGSMQGLGKFSSNLYRLNTSNGRSTLQTLGGPPEVQAWVVDRNHVPRAATSSIGGATSIYFRDTEQAPWRVIFKFEVADIPNAVAPLAFDASGKLYLSAYAGADNAAIFGFDAKSGRLDAQPVVAVNGFDLGGGLRFNVGGTRLLGVDYTSDRHRTHWIDDEIAKMQALVDRSLPGSENYLQLAAGTGTSPVLVHSHSDRDPGRYLLFDPRSGSLTVIAQSRPWIPVDRMKPTRFYRYAARDGLQIPAQLTTPAGEGNFPLVVLHYGGPWVRPIEWNWDPIVQFLVSRGYAVFMPAPRASTGFGAKLYVAGWKQWGLGMQDDVTDGVRDLIKRGVADPKRVCIAGASYGGYLAMMGLAKEPDLFRCGINWVGVTDPSFMFTVTWTDFNRVDAARYTLPLLIGDPSKDAEQFKRTSPVERAAEIKQPVLMAYGALDDRVPLINGEKMRSALSPHNKKVEWVVYSDEGHGWLRVDNNVDFWTRVEKFLAANL